MRLSTRAVRVESPLMSVSAMVDKGHTVIFDSAGSYAVNKKTGRTTKFTRSAGSWHVSFDLEAPDVANKVMAAHLAELSAERSVQQQQQEAIFEVSVNRRLEHGSGSSSSSSIEHPFGRRAWMMP